MGVSFFEANIILNKADFSHFSFHFPFVDSAFISIFSNTGTMFILAPSKRFTDEVLPELFSHSSLSAFTRQLNVRFQVHEYDRDS